MQTPTRTIELLEVLDRHHAYFRTDDRRLEPKASHLASPGHKLLMTTLGQIDVLGELGAGESYEALLPAAVEVQIDHMPIRVLGLQRLIEAKERAGREKDLAVLPLLRSTLARLRKT